MHVLFVIFPFATFQAVCNGFTYGKPEVNHLAANHFRDVHRRLKRSLVCGPGQVDKMPGSCALYKTFGFCTAALVTPFMTTSCPVTCGFCVPCIPDQRPLSFCTRYKRFGFCVTSDQSIKQFMETNCYTTCGFCIVPTTMPAPTTTPEVPTTMPAPTTTTEVPTTMPALTTTPEVPTTMPSPTTTPEVPTTMPAPTTTPEVPTTMPAPTTTPEVPTTMPTTTTEEPTTMPPPTTTPEVPTTMPATTTTLEVPTTVPTPTTTPEMPTTIPAPTTTPEVPTTMPTPTTSPEVPTTIPAPTKTPEVPTSMSSPTTMPEVSTIMPAPTTTPEVPTTMPAPTSTLEVPTTTTTPTTSPMALCIPDQRPKSLCRTYKGFGFCVTSNQSIKQYMETNCFTTCGFCIVPTTMPAPTTTPAVNGNWSMWGVWGVCSVTCGGGQQVRRRACINPPPSGSGSDCVGNSSQTQSCNSNLCPGVSAWSDWSNWSSCSQSCGVSLRIRIRDCSNPPPTTPESFCKGENFEIETCSTTGCVVSTTMPAPTTTPAASTTISTPTTTPAATTTEAATTLTPVTDTPSPLNGADAACLKAHNDKRSVHGSPRLTWNATLAEHAQYWAHELVRLGRLMHQQGISEGENLFKSSGQTEKTCVDAVRAWYGEIAQYNFNNPGFSPATGHFTQVVWKATTQVGVATITELHPETGNLDTYVVARYTPAGNVLGKFEQNVLPTSIIENNIDNCA